MSLPHCCFRSCSLHLLPLSIVLQSIFFMVISFCYRVILPLSLFLNFSSHYSYKSVFSLPVHHLSLTALCPLFLRLVCHVIRFPHERHHVTLLLAFSHLTLSKPASLDTCLLWNLYCSNAILFLFLLLSRFLTQDNQERSGTAPTERPVDSQESLCAGERTFFSSLRMALRCQFEPQRGSFACFWL